MSYMFKVKLQAITNMNNIPNKYQGEKFFPKNNNIFTSILNTWNPMAPSVMTRQAGSPAAIFQLGVL